MELIITKGLPGSGKSTWSKQWAEEDPKHRIRVNRDDIRRMLGSYWVPSRENLITDIEDDIIFSALGKEYSVIIDATNFNINHLNSIKFAKEILKIPVIIKDFTDVPIETCIQRDREREHSVGEEVIKRMARKYLNYKDE